MQYNILLATYSSYSYPARQLSTNAVPFSQLTLKELYKKY